MSVETKTNSKMNTEINTELVMTNTATASAVVDVAPKKKVLKTKGVVGGDTEAKEKPAPIFPLQRMDAISAGVSVMTDAEYEAELQESDRQLQLAMERSKAIRMKKALGAQAMEIISKVRDNLLADIKSNRDAIKKMTAENKEFEAELARLEAIKPETDDVVGFLQQNYKDYIDEVLDNQVSREVVREVVPAKSSAGGSSGRVRTNIDREATRDAIPDRMVLRASAKHKTDKDLTVVLDVIYNAQTKKFYRYGKGEKTEYALLQDANREWCNARGLTKLDNAWEVFKALDKEGTIKPIPIDKLHLPEGNWTTDMNPETLARFIDRKFKF
jgi:hypothetical protein